MVTLNTGYYQRIGSSASYAQFDVNGNEVAPSIAGLGYINGVPQADQFPGSDACQKIYNAGVYAIANGLPMVDATHFKGLQACTSGAQMFSGGQGQPLTPPSILTSSLARSTSRPRLRRLSTTRL